MNIKYYKLKRQYSENGGVTWLDLGAYKVGDVVETNSSCETDDEQVLTREVQLSVDDAYTCDGYDKRYIISHQQSTDGGIIWTETHQTIGDVAEINSSDCGYSGCDLIAKYNVTATYYATQVLDRIDNIAAMYVDDVKTTVSTGHVFSTTGEHIVKFTLTDCTEIAEMTFASRDNLTSIEIPNSVTSIGSYAFDMCTSLTSITIPNSVKSIGSYAFGMCTSLTSITIPNSVTSIGWHAFEYCSDLTSVTIGNSVTSIGDYAFKNCSGLTSIEIPNSVTSIGWHAFEYCSGLTSVTIGNSVTSIGDSAFTDCYHLTSIELPSSVTSIGTNAFLRCTSLKTVDIVGNTSTTVGVGAFRACYELTNVEIENTSVIYENAFAYCSGLTDVVLGDGVQIINDNVFYSCTKLTNVTIGSGITSIGETAFYENNLKSITCYATTAPTINSKTFDSCGSGGMLFYPCEADYSKWLSTSTYYLGWYGWQSDCIDETGTITVCDITCTYNITTTTSKTKILNSAYPFYRMYIDGVEVPISKSYKFSTTGEHTVRFTLTKNSIINDEAFFGCYALTSVEISGCVGAIGRNAFKSCTALTSVTIGSGVTSIGNNAFQNCQNLTSIEIPNSVTSIGNEAFAACNGLTSVILPSHLNSINDYMFYECRSLASVNIPSGVTHIGCGAFYQCGALTSIELPFATTSFSDNAFRYSNLTSITINNNIDFITLGECAINGLPSNGILHYPCNLDYAKEWSTYLNGWTYECFSNNNEFNEPLNGYDIVCQYYTTRRSKRLYNSTFGDFVAMSVDGSDDITPTNEYTFGDSGYHIVRYKLEDGVTTVSSGFTDVTGLTAVIFGDKVTNPGQRSFQGCTTLTSVTIPSSVTSIGDEAFKKCSGLTSIEIPNSVTSIGYGAFDYCDNLTSIEIPSSVTSIGNNAFSNCSKLNSITCYATTAPTIKPSTFYHVRYGCILYYPSGSDYSSWLRTSTYYLGWYGWTGQEI